MMFNFMRLCLAILAITLCLCSKQALKIPIDSAFVVEIGDCIKDDMIGKVMNTTIPTTLHLDLFRNNQIDDPFYGDNYQSLRWISECNATYSKDIVFPRTILQRQVIQLVFEGIDTYSVIYFNGQALLQTKNAFVQYTVNIPKDKIKDGVNHLKVEIQATKRRDQIGNGRQRMPFLYAHTRKPAYQYGWDWAPNVKTVGIWKPIYFQAYTGYKINYVWIRHKSIKEQKAILNFVISFLNTTKYEKLKDNYVLRITNKNTQQKNSYQLNQSQYNYIDVDVLNPKLWWPHGIGEPYLYNFNIQLVRKQTQQIIDRKSIDYGIRTTQLNLENSQFTVVVNGYNIYCKGANYVPPDMFYPRLINPDYTPVNTIEQILDDVIESNFNMIRVWGGGQYQSEHFLQLASKKGIMIFYDFMFSDSIYPATDVHLANIEVQIKQQLIKARNYPCVVLWCGNNQILQGILSWGWSKPNYQTNYEKLFEQFIPRLMKKYSFNVPYIPSSPLYGIGNSGFQKGGDVHYWGVWAAQSRFQAYKTSIGPFNSQFGTQGLPVWQTVKTFTDEDKLSYQDNSFAVHQRHGSKFTTLKKYHMMYGNRSKDMESQTYLSGLIQAFGVQMAIKYQRMAKPYSYGTLYWQLNDAWPGISWSSMDYYGRWKPLQYMAKRNFANVAVFTDQQLKIKAINDNIYKIGAVVIIKIQLFSGQLILNQTKSINLQSNEVKQIMNLDNNKYRSKKNSIVIYTQIIAGKQKQMWSTTFLEHFKSLALEKSTLFVKYNKRFNIIFVRTNKFIKNLYISHRNQYIKLSDNYFDMLANEQYKVILDHKYKLEQLKDGLIYRSYLQIQSTEQLDVVIEEQK